MFRASFIEHPKQARFSFASGYASLAIKLLKITVAVLALGVLATVSLRALVYFDIPLFLISSYEFALSVYIFMGFVFLVASLSFVLWLYRAYRNLAPLGGSRLYFTPKWAFLGFILPVANMFIPYYFIADTCRVSDEASRNQSCSLLWERLPIPAVVNKWWYAHLINLVAIPMLVAFIVSAEGELSDDVSILILTMSLIASLFWCSYAIGIIKSVELDQLDGFDKQKVKDFCTRKAVCPKCGHDLRTKKAKQCPSCLLDWHDEKAPRYLSSHRIKA